MLESGVSLLMIIAFSAITVVVIISLITLAVKFGKGPYLAFFAVQWLFTTAAFAQFIRTVEYSPNGPVAVMYSESISYFFGVCGVLWGISIIFMLIGVWSFGLRQRKGGN